ncbi:MAG: CRTAC1 family protein [Planctomycetes bacterium]|nr:CRTAC1 family protein [Planctomycetota bacterium]
MAPSDAAPSPAPTLTRAALPEPDTGPWFTDGTVAAGLAHRDLSGPRAPDKFYLRDTIGQGIAVLDADGDGRMDLYFPQGRDGTPDGGDSRNRLYRNRGDRTFAEEGAVRGVDDPSYSYGALAFDVDVDGDTDLYVTNLGPNVLFRNDGARFVDATAAHPGLAGGAIDWSTGAAAGDVDADGDLDLYVANYCEQDLPSLDQRGLCHLMACEVPCGPRTLPAQADLFFENAGAPDYTLRPALAAAGLADVSTSYGFQPAFTDIDDDGDLDLYVTNDSMFNFLFVNDGNGHFREAALPAGVACGRAGVMEAGMGLAVAQIDDDPLPELFVTNFSIQSHTLYRNLTTAADAPWFDDVTGPAGIGRPTWFPLGWGCQIADLDDDGHADVFASNGHIYPQVDACKPDLVVYRQHCNLFLGTDDPFAFVDRTGLTGPAFAEAGPHRAAVAADLDDDGDLDLVVSRMDETPILAWNAPRDGGHWLSLRVERVPAEGAPAALAVGARVTLATGARRFTRDVSAGGGFLSSDDPRLHFGLGPATRVERIELRLPGGERREVARDVEVDRHLRLRVEADGSVTLDAARGAR